MNNADEIFSELFHIRVDLFYFIFCSSISSAVLFGQIKLICCIISVVCVCADSTHSLHALKLYCFSSLWSWPSKIALNLNVIVISNLLFTTYTSVWIEALCSCSSA